MKKRSIFEISLLAAACALVCAFLAAAPQARGASFYGLIKKGNRFFKNDLFREAMGYYIKGGEKKRLISLKKCPLDSQDEADIFRCAK